MTAERGEQVGISPEEFMKRYPQLFHMAETGSWDSIKKLGLLSTSALLDKFEVEESLRSLIELSHRPQSITIEHPLLGSAVIRDQKPLRESSLRKCLIDMKLPEWYGLLNGKVFFWPSEERLSRLLSARAYRDSAHCIIAVETKLLLDRYQDKISLSRINSGSTLFNPQRRGRRTFVPLSEFPYQARRKRCGVRNALAEIAVDDGIPDIEELASRVVHMKRGEVLEVLYERISE